MLLASKAEVVKGTVCARPNANNIYVHVYTDIVLLKRLNKQSM